MIKIRNECCDCGLPCLGNTCPNLHVKHYICDICGNEPDHLYRYEGQELCIDCIKEQLEEVE